MDLVRWSRSLSVRSRRGSTRHFAAGGLLALSAMHVGAASAATLAALCESAKLKAASTYSLCRGKADAAYAKSSRSEADRVKQGAAYRMCDDSLVKAYGVAEGRFGLQCPTTGDVESVRVFLTKCASDVAGAAQGGVLQDYEAELAACSGGLAAVQAGTATSADVSVGRTFSSSAGIGVTGTAWPNALLRTGQTTSYGPGSDGGLQVGAVQSFVDNGDGTVTDTRTGLTWEKKSRDGSVHDWQNVYVWGQELSPYAMNGTMVTTFLAALNTPPCFAGYCDWRIPNGRELASLVNWEVSNPATFAAFNASCTAGCAVTACSCTRSGPSGHWSSSTLQYYPDYAWSVYFDSGGVYSVVKREGLYVRAVRGGAGS